MSLAWHITWLDRRKTLPALKTLFAENNRKTLATQSEVQTVPQQRAMLQMISEKYGLRLVKREATR